MDTKKVSKTFSHALRHAPEEYGIVLDENGWTDLFPLAGIVSRRFKVKIQEVLTALETAISQSDKQRFEFDRETGRIRAFYGHSVPTKIERAAVEPPEYLYHGTPNRNLESIRAEGLLPMTRQYVHSSEHKERE